jgi:uncharacterized OB-fold protein
MALLAELSQIAPNPTTAPFWDAFQRRELRVQKCGACERFRHPPIPGCPHCGSPRVEWTLLSGRGRIFSYTFVHHPALPSLAESVPYNVIVVELDGAPGARLISNLLEAEPHEIEIGRAVQVAWEDVRPDLILPRFRLIR